MLRIASPMLLGAALAVCVFGFSADVEAQFRERAAGAKTTASGGKAAGSGAVEIGRASCRERV